MYYCVCTHVPDGLRSGYSRATTRARRSGKENGELQLFGILSKTVNGVDVRSISPGMIRDYSPRGLRAPVGVTIRPTRPQAGNSKLLGQIRYINEKSPHHVRGHALKMRRLRLVLRTLNAAESIGRPVRC